MTTIDNAVNHPLYEAAEEWYNATPKNEVLEFCESHGTDLNDGEQLNEDWISEAIICRIKFLEKAETL